MKQFFDFIVRYNFVLPLADGFVVSFHSVDLAYSNFISYYRFEVSHDGTVILWGNIMFSKSCFRCLNLDYSNPSDIRFYPNELTRDEPRILFKFRSFDKWFNSFRSVLSLIISNRYVCK